MRPIPLAEALGRAAQVAAVVALVAYFALLLHKGALDIGALREAHSGSEFWRALGRHILRILGGG